MVGGTTMFLRLEAPKVMLIKLMMSIRTPAATVVFNKLMESELRPVNQPGNVKDKYISGYLA